MLSPALTFQSAAATAPAEIVNTEKNIMKIEILLTPRIYNNSPIL